MNKDMIGPFIIAVNDLFIHRKLFYYDSHMKENK